MNRLNEYVTTKKSSNELPKSSRGNSLDHRFLSNNRSECEFFFSHQLARPLGAIAGIVGTGERSKSLSIGELSVHATDRGLPSNAVFFFHDDAVHV